MALARILILVSEEDGWGLYRYAANGEFAGDTWHETEDEAVKHARWAYGKALGSWQPISTRARKLDSVARAVLKNVK